MRIIENNFKTVTTVIFDMDGLLLNTEPVYEKCFAELCEKYGNKLTKQARMKLLGTTERRSCEICVNDLSLNVTVDQFVSDFRQMSKPRLENVEFMPGAERLIKHLHANNIPICVATSSTAEGVEVKTKRHQDIFKLFHHITKGTDPGVKEGKPAPDIFLLAASRFEPQADPKNCLVIEDSPNGVTGALAAGMQALIVPADTVSDEARSRATFAVRSLEHFQPELFGLPPFDCVQNAYE